MTGIVINMPRRILDAYHEWFLYISGLGPARSAPFQDVEFFRVAHVGMVILLGIMALTCLIRKIRQDGNKKCDLWDYANRYAKYGDILVGGDATIQSYMGLMEECGVNFTISYWDYPEWNRMEQNPEVAAMPEYPKEGYLKTIGDNIVIKVAQ